MNWIKGRKTYIVAGLMVLVSLLDVMTGDTGIMEFFKSEDLTVLLSGIGLGTLRAGVTNG